MNIDAIEKWTGNPRTTALICSGVHVHSFCGSVGKPQTLPALPFCHLRLSTQKPKHSAYPKELKTLGDRIRKRRLDLGLFQRQVAERMSVDEDAVFRWERNESSPQVHKMPEIIRFLGYNPLPTFQSEGERLIAAQKVRGLTQKHMAQRLGVDPTTLARWERGNCPRSGKFRRIVETFLSLDRSKSD